MSRIDFNDSVHDLVGKIGEMNTGAMKVCLDSMKKSRSIDPESGLGSMTPIILLDQFEIYGKYIWLLYKDVCNQSIINFCAVLRAVQLGIITRSYLRNSIVTLGVGINCDEILSCVKSRLVKFDKKQVVK